MSDEIETIYKNPKSWAAWKREAERLQGIIDGMALAAMDGEPVRNPVLAYADSYRDMAKQGFESVPIWSVITDLERNIAPLYRHAQPVPRVPDGYVMVPKEMTDEIGEAIAMQANCCGGIALDIYDAMLAAAPHDTPALNSPQSVDSVTGGWIPVSERMPLTPSADCEYSDIEVNVFDGERVFTAHYATGSQPQPLGYWVDTYAKITHWQPLPAAPQEVKP